MQITSTSSYRPHGGGDFTDVVESADGTVRALIGDVMGHGPDEAELGERLRKVWHSAVAADVPDEQLLPLMHGVVVESARTAGPLGRFATACQLTLTAGEAGVTARVRSAGHPAPLLVGDDPAHYADLHVGPPLGVPSLAAEELWQPVTFQVPPRSCVLLFTDGLLDAYATGDSLGFEGLAEAVDRLDPARGGDRAWLSRLLDGAPHSAADDAALVVLAIP